MTASFFLILLIIITPMVLSATAPVLVHPKPNKVKRHKPVKHQTYLAESLHSTDAAMPGTSLPEAAAD